MLTALIPDRLLRCSTVIAARGKSCWLRAKVRIGTLTAPTTSYRNRGTSSDGELIHYPNTSMEVQSIEPSKMGKMKTFCKH